MQWGIRGVALALAMAVWAGGGVVMAEQSKRTALAAVDHLLLGVSDLDAGIAWVEKLTGVKAVPGGSHPGVGTRNALVSLGGTRYLEIIAPDPAQAAFNYRVDLRTFKEPRLIGWAAMATDVAAVAAGARAAGQEVFGPRDGSRARPDGRMLQWKIVAVPSDLGAHPLDPVPFFIQWAPDSVHPSADSPKGCELQSFDIQHPRASEVTTILERVGIQAQVRAGDARLTAVLQCPKGRVELR